MAHTDMLKVDGVAIQSPSAMKVSLQDISAAGSGRTQDGKMQKNRIAQKYKIELQWNNVTPTVASTILAAFNPEYFQVNFTDPLTNTAVTKWFYAGDRSSPIKIWTTNTKIYEQVAFNIIER